MRNVVSPDRSARKLAHASRSCTSTLLHAEDAKEPGLAAFGDRYRNRNRYGNAAGQRPCAALTQCVMSRSTCPVVVTGTGAS